MTFLKMVLALFARNSSTGTTEPVDKTNDARHALHVEDQHTDLATETTQNRRLGGNKKPVTFTVTSSALPFVYTPAAGKSVRMFWFTAAPDPSGGIFPQISVTIGSLEVYRIRGAVAHWEVFDGAADETVTVSIDVGATVDGTMHIEEL